MVTFTDSHLSMVNQALAQQSEALLLFKPVGQGGLIGPIAGAISIGVVAYIADQIQRRNLAAAWYLGPLFIGWLSVFSASATAGGTAPGSAIFNGMLSLADELSLDFVKALDTRMPSGFFVSGTDEITGAALPWRNLAETEFSTELSSSLAWKVRHFASECITDDLIANLEGGGDGQTILDSTPIRVGGSPTTCSNYASTIDADLSTWVTPALPAPAITKFAGMRAVAKEILPVVREESHEISLLARGYAADQMTVVRSERLLNVSSERFGEYIGGWTWLMALLYFFWLILIFTPWAFPATGIYFALLLAGRAQVWGFYAIHSYDKASALADPVSTASPPDLAAFTVTVLNAFKLYGLRLAGDVLNKHRAYEAGHYSTLALEEKAIVAVPVITALLLVLMFVFPRLRRAL